MRNYALLIVSMFLFSSAYAQRQGRGVPPAETVGTVKEKIVKGKIKPSEITGDKGDWELCFTCKICKDKSFQRFYLRFITAKKRTTSVR